MSIVPIFSPFSENEIKMRIIFHSRKQLLIGNSIQSITVSGVQTANCIDSKKEDILYRQLITIENMYDTKVVKISGEMKFKGIFFYGIIPNNKNKRLHFIIQTPMPRM